jgi:ribonuclease VapC
LIAIDTSALMAILLQEPKADACQAVIDREPKILLSAGTMTEAMIVAGGRNFSPQMLTLIENLRPEFITVTATTAQRIGLAYSKWGRGNHPAALNFGDCFAYDTAKEHNCPLLFIGGDFSKTDILSAL